MNSGLLVLAALTVVTVLLPIAGIGPLVLRGKRARNNLLFVSMYPPEQTGPAQDWRAVRAQEIVEWWLRWAVALPIAALSLLIDAGPYQWAVALIAVLVASLWSELAGGRFDTIGRAVEVVVANRSGYLQTEAERLQREWYRGRTVEDCARMIERRLPLARVLVLLLRRSIARA